MSLINMNDYKLYLNILSPANNINKLDDDIDWFKLYQLSITTGTSGVLYIKIINSNLTQTECPVITDLKKIYNKYLYYNLRIIHHYEILANKITKAGIPFIPLKGIVLINDYYNHIGMRVTSDIDLLFRREDSDIYLSLFGIKHKIYQPAYFFSKYVYDKFDSKMIADYSIEGISVDLHERLHVPWYPFKISIKEVWRAAYETAEDVTSLRMSSEHLLIYLVTHLYRHLQGHLQNNKPFKFIWFYDIAVVLNAERNNLNEVKLLNIAKSWDCHEILCCMVNAVAEAFDLHVTKVIRKEANMYKNGKKEAIKSIYHFLNPSDTAYTPNLNLKFWNPNKIKYSLLHNIFYMISFLFPSRSYLKSCYPSTSSLFILTRYPQWLLSKIGGKIYLYLKKN